MRDELEDFPFMVLDDKGGEKERLKLSIKSMNMSKLKSEQLVEAKRHSVFSLHLALVEKPECPVSEIGLSGFGLTNSLHLL